MFNDALVIDDDFDVLVTICDLLGEKNFVCQGCSSGAEALALGSKLQDFKIIFTDIRMPQLNGFELVHRLRANRISCPIVALTGLPDRGKSIYELTPQDQRMLPNLVLSKPMDLQSLAKIEQLISSHSHHLASLETGEFKLAI